MIFSRELKKNSGKMVAWLLILGIIVGLLFALYPMMLDGNMKSLFDNFINELSPDLQKIFGIEENIDLTNIGQYMAFIYQYISVFIVIFAMQLGANSLSSDQSDGTIQYIYSNPVSRAEIITEKILSNILTYIIFLILLALVNFLVLLFIPVEEAFSKQELIFYLAKIFSGILASGLVFMSIGFFISSLSKTNNFGNGISILFVIISVIFTIVGKIYGGTMLTVIDNLPLEVFKPIYFIEGIIYPLGLGVNLIIFLIFIVLTYVIYGSKELDY